MLNSNKFFKDLTSMNVNDVGYNPDSGGNGFQFGGVTNGINQILHASDLRDVFSGVASFVGSLIGGMV